MYIIREQMALFIFFKSVDFEKKIDVGKNSLGIGVLHWE